MQNVIEWFELVEVEIKLLGRLYYELKPCVYIIIWGKCSNMSDSINTVSQELN